MVKLNINDLKKIKFLMKKKFFLKNKRKYYFKKIKKILIFCKNNLNFIYYDQIFFFLKNSNLFYLKKILFIIKNFGINIYENIPNINEFIIKIKSKNKNFKKKIKIKKYNDNSFKKVYFKKKKINIFKNYKKINFLYKKIKNKLFLDFFVFKILLSKIKIKNKKKYIYKLKKNKKKNKNNLKSLEYFYNFYKLLKKNKKNKLNVFINKKNKFNKKNKLNFNLFFFENIYRILYKYYNYLNKIKYELYDILTNLSNINFIEFNFYFNKNGSDINWIYNISDLSNFNKKIKKKYIYFIKKNKKKLKNMEKKINMPLINFIKIFSYININKFKIDIIKNNILESNLYLVKKITNKYYKKELYWDYIQEGIIGLINSINKYDYRYKNFKLFFLSNIKSNISKFIYKNEKLIRLPNYIITLTNKINKIIKEYFNKFKEKPSIEFIKKKVKASEKQIKRVLNVYKNPISIDSFINNDSSDIKISEFLKDENILNIEDRILEEQIKDFLNSILIDFDKKDREIISMIYGINGFKKHKLTELKLIYNISLNKIRKLKNLFLKIINNKNNLKKIKILNDN